ncbi:MAG: hypothetical protein A2X36_06720 [Elusimicrobia bacterium GWA2_69_24]|nr:MAG: hypothetical protein A2X36_06720 [Elusimicrobia bacterium GWA2_69_24]HBL19011.1 beta-N-acetylhexosaminidase [Elusimicrobiota bacterium]
MEPTPFIFSIEGARPTRSAVSLLKETDAAGIILFARNIQSPAQVRALVRGLQDAVGRRLLVCIDHEGGWVLRFVSGLTAFPGNAALGKAGDPRLARAAGARMASELRALGVGVNFAPVLDVVERYNPGIGIRSFGGDPRAVARLGSAFIRGHQGAGVAACAKHFPGKGAATVDAHVSLPTIRIPIAEFSRVHLAPFRAAIGAGVASIMTSHLSLPALDPSKTPATFSRRIVHGLLRRTMGYEGVIISDDLCMGGAMAGNRTVSEATVEALRAGHDLVIISQSPAIQLEAHEQFRLADESGLTAPQERKDRARRIARFLRQWTPVAAGPLPRPDRRLPAEIAGKAVEVLRQGGAALPLRLTDGTRKPVVAVLWPDFREVRERFTFEGGVDAPLRNIRRRLASWPARLRFVLTPVAKQSPKSPLPKDILAADLVLVFCFEALRFPGQRQVLEALQRVPQERQVALLLRSPWDVRLLGPRVTALTAWGYREAQVDALVRRLR